jgi:hypothetical protein
MHLRSSPWIAFLRRSNVFKRRRRNDESEPNHSIAGPITSLETISKMSSSRCTVRSSLRFFACPPRLFSQGRRASSAVRIKPLPKGSRREKSAEGREEVFEIHSSHLTKHQDLRSYDRSEYITL